MNFQQFVVMIKEKTEFLLEEDTSVRIHTTLKNNGRIRTGLTISEEHVKIFPTIYLEEYYQQFLKGCSVDVIAESIVDIYRGVDFERVQQANSIKDLETIRHKIVYKVIHTERNRKLLQTLPHIPYLDLSIVFYILFDVDETGIATVPIAYNLMNLWEIDLETLYDIARKNTPQLLPASFQPMHVVVEELTGITPKEFPEKDILFVLSNSLRNFGACCILYDNVLLQIGEQLGESFYILPSSIHEVIIVPESECPTEKDLNEMIYEINQTQMDLEEVLSDRVYRYDYKQRRLL